MIKEMLFLREIDSHIKAVALNKIARITQNGMIKIIFIVIFEI